MRIAHVIAQDPTRFRGGTEAVALSLARAAAEEGHAVRVVAPRAGVDADREDLDPDAAATVELVRVTPRRDPSPAVFLDAVARNAVLAATRDADVVHVHHWYASSLDLVRHLAVDRVVVAHLHDAFATCARGFGAGGDVACPTGAELLPCARCVASDLGVGADDALARLEERRAHLRAELAAADAVVAPSRFLAAHVARALGVATPRVIEHGVALPVDPDRDLARDDRAAGAPLRVLLPGHRASVKGCLDVARAVGGLPAGSVTLVCRGREVEPGIDDAIRRLARGAARFEGAYEPGDWPAMAADADLVVVPSRAAEGFGLVAAEALAHGAPTWVAASGALPERVAAASASHPLFGRVLPAADPKSWSEALRELVADPDLLQDARRLGAASIRCARDAAREWLDLYRALLAADPRRLPKSA